MHIKCVSGRLPQKIRVGWEFFFLLFSVFCQGKNVCVSCWLVQWHGEKKVNFMAGGIWNRYKSFGSRIKKIWLVDSLKKKSTFLYLAEAISS